MKNSLVSIREDMFAFVFQMAIGDATRRVAFEEEKERLAECKDIVKKYAETVINEGKAQNISSLALDIRRVCGKVSFGKIQKMVNMTMKYLYIKFYDEPDWFTHFEACDAPMDSLMRDFVYESYKYLGLGKKPGFIKGCAWSQLNEGDKENPVEYYYAFQKAIDEIIAYVNGNRKLIKNKIEFDYMFWDKAVMLRDKRTKEQKALVKAIWSEIGIKPKDL